MDGIRADIRVEGIVQGVGFRPFVYGLATRNGLAGHVGNDADGVFIAVEGSPDAVSAFVVALTAESPPLASIERVHSTTGTATGIHGFSIVDSPTEGAHHTLVSADTATCIDCLRELFDPADRRFGYPFLNCTNCGPRFTIVRDIPYDRPQTTMAGFAMCSRCRAEYEDPADRRFHAQPTCCADCGPQLQLTDAAGANLAGDPIDQAAQLLRSGAVIGIKGLGGYHLAVDATISTAAEALRSRKHREDKPFALMVTDLDAARELCEIDGPAEELLTSRRRPIVLLSRHPDTSIASAVAPRTRELGIMLPYTPLHHLLLRAVGRPIVLTSGNVSDEPIAYTDADAAIRLAGIADAFLSHDRTIHIRTDDSVTRSHRGREMLLRRSRGHVPEPLRLDFDCAEPILACGAELKNTFGLATGRHAFLSHHIGDLENYETLRSFSEGIEHFSRLFEIEPKIIAYDMHPEYLSTKYALERGGARLVPVQHHHAHIAACLVDNHERGPAIGIAFDGSGYGPDDTIWGGEFLLADFTGYERLGHLAPIPLPGGETAIRQPWRMAAAYLDSAYPDGLPGDLAVRRRNADSWDNVTALARSGLNSPPTSSVGRLLDAAAAILDLRDAVTYEGQAAILLEQAAEPAAEPAETSAYTMSVSTGTPFQIAGTDLIQALVEDLMAGVDRSIIAARVHNGISAAVTAACRRIRDNTGNRTVALSGGVFQNLLLAGRLIEQLESEDFLVLTHSRVPPNDGGISLGQVAVASADTR